jgi:hypothetical protein
MAPDVASMTSTPSTPALKPSQKPLSGPNVLEVVFGSLLIQPWYPSFYPEELVGRRVERLYVCQWCFKYSKELLGFIGHLVRFFPYSYFPSALTGGVAAQLTCRAIIESMSPPQYTPARRQRLHKRQLLALRD